MGAPENDLHHFFKHLLCLVGYTTFELEGTTTFWRSNAKDWGSGSFALVTARMCAAISLNKWIGALSLVRSSRISSDFDGTFTDSDLGKTGRMYDLRMDPQPSFLDNGCKLHNFDNQVHPQSLRVWGPYWLPWTSFFWGIDSPWADLPPAKAHTSQKLVARMLKKSLGTDAQHLVIWKRNDCIPSLISWLNHQRLWTWRLNSKTSFHHMENEHSHIILIWCRIWSSSPSFCLKLVMDWLSC